MLAATKSDAPASPPVPAKAVTSRGRVNSPRRRSKAAGVKIPARAAAAVRKEKRDAGPGESPGARIIEGLTEALSIAKGEAEPYRVTAFAAHDDGTPLFNPACPSCVKKRALETAKTTARVAKWRARQKETT